MWEKKHTHGHIDCADKFVHAFFPFPHIDIEVSCLKTCTHVAYLLTLSLGGLAPFVLHNRRDEITLLAVALGT